MTVRRVYHKVKLTSEEVERLRKDRERYQREKPTVEQLLAEGAHTSTISLQVFMAMRPRR